MQYFTQVHAVFRNIFAEFLGSSGTLWKFMELCGTFAKMCGDFFSSRWPYVVHKLSQSKPQLLVHPLPELAKTSDHFAIPYCT
jgi:hypothetical protein